MRTTAFLTLASLALVGAQTTGKLGDAAVINNNPLGAMYEAVFNSPKNSIRGSVVASSVPGGKGVQFAMSINGLPSTGGPFAFHIHDQPVPADGNCTATLAHLDPYQRGQTPACDKLAPQTCEVGDLSGKYGTINETQATRTFIDYYAALVPGIGAFFGNRSIVIHYANSTRLACVNWAQIGSGGSPTGSASIPSGTGVVAPGGTTLFPSGKPTTSGTINGTSPTGAGSVPTPKVTTPIGGNGAGQLMVGTGAVLAAAAALLF